MPAPDPEGTPVVILCGGQGTRIREASEKLPKPLVDIGGQPILWHIMKMYGAYGFRRFILCLGYKAWSVKKYFLQYEDLTSDVVIDLSEGTKRHLSDEPSENWEISLVDTGLHSGTGERLRRVASLIDSDYFMVTYADGVADIDFSAQLEHLRTSDYKGLVTGVHPTSRYGELGVDGQQRVVNFAEKPPSDGWVSGGFFAFRRSFLDYLEVDEPNHFFEQTPIRKLTAEGGLGLFPHTGFWMGMDTYREYVALNQMWDEGLAAWKVW